MHRRQFLANFREFVSFVVCAAYIKLYQLECSSFACMINIKIEIVFVNLLFPSWSWFSVGLLHLLLYSAVFFGNMFTCCRKMCHLALNSVFFNIALSLSLSLYLFWFHEDFRNTKYSPVAVPLSVCRMQNEMLTEVERNDHFRLLCSWQLLIMAGPPNKESLFYKFLQWSSWRVRIITLCRWLVAK